MTSLILSGTAYAKKVSRIDALTRIVGSDRYSYHHTYTPISLHPGEIGVVCREVKTREQLRVFVDWYGPMGKQLLLGTELTREELEPLQGVLQERGIRVEYLDYADSQSTETVRQEAEEWAKTWWMLFPLSGKFVIDAKFRQYLKESKNLFAILDWTNIDDLEKILKIFLDDVSRPYLLAHDGGAEVKKYLVGWLNLVVSSFKEIHIPHVLWQIIFSYVA